MDFPLNLSSIATCNRVLTRLFDYEKIRLHSPSYVFGRGFCPTNDGPKIEGR